MRAVVVMFAFVSLLTAGLTDEMPVPLRQDLVRFEIVSPEQARSLDRQGVTINEVQRDYCIAEASPELLQQLAVQGWKFTVLRENVSAEYYQNFSTESSDGRYLTYQEFIDTMNIIATNNPGICRLETLATTSTGRLVLMMKVSDNVNANEPEPAIIWDANTHGDEKIGWAVAFEFLKYLLNNYGTNPDVTYLVNNREIWICPMFNPDGYVNSTRYNARSVDLNRNWGWMWGEESAPGQSVMSEAETRGLVNLLFRNPISIWVSYHAGTEAISYPWSYTDYDSIPEKRAIDQLSAGYSTRGNSYPYGQGSQIMYLINGSSKDLGYGAMGAMSWSIEVHYTKTPPASEIDPTFLRNRDAMLWFCRKAGHGINGVITDSITGLPVRAQIWLNPHNWPSYSEKINGDFHRYALPGTYSLTVQAPGYEPKTVNNVVVPATGDSSVSIEIQLMPNPARPLFGFQMVACSAVTISSNRTYPVRALGPQNGVAFSLDNNHWIIIDMDQPVRNGTGNDFSVFRSSGTGTATVQAANSWIGPWTTVGTANSARTDFDLGAVGLDSARYFRLKASGQFMLDAIEANQLTGIAARESLLPGTGVNSLTVRPSIVRERLEVECRPAAVASRRIAIYDAAGQVIDIKQLTPGQTTLMLGPEVIRALRPGIYFVRATDDTVPASHFAVVR